MLQYLMEWITSDFIPELGTNHNGNMCVRVESTYIISLDCKHSKKTRLVKEMCQQQILGVSLQESNKTIDMTQKLDVDNLRRSLIRFFKNSQ